jgi:hypothetical protein
MNATRVAVTCAAGLLAAAAGFALARGDSHRTSCGNGHALPERGHRYDLPRLGPLALQAGYRGDLLPGYPYKVGITRYAASHETIELRGWRCDDHRPLHFLYRSLRLPKPPLTAAELQRLGSPVGRLRWYRAPEGQSLLIYAGYMLFWAHGDWKIEASAGRKVVGELVLRL